MFLENTIINFYANYIKRTDTYKDVDNKGVFERFNEVIGNDIDNKITPFIYNLHDNLLIPDLVMSKMIPILEYSLGISVDLGDTYKRTILQYITKFYKVKGTTLGYSTMFEMLGFTNTEIILEDTLCIGDTFDTNNFDDPCSFDIGTGTIGCSTCYPYRIILTGILTVTPEIESMVASIIEFNEPINAQLTGVTYSGIDGDFNDDFNEDYSI